MITLDDGSGGKAMYELIKKIRRILTQSHKVTRLQNITPLCLGVRDQK